MSGTRKNKARQVHESKKKASARVAVEGEGGLNQRQQHRLFTNMRRQFRRKVTALSDDDTCTLSLSSFRFEAATASDEKARSVHESLLHEPSVSLPVSVKSRRVRSVDGYDLVYHFPESIPSPVIQEYNSKLTRYGKALDVKADSGADAGKGRRGDKTSYVNKPGYVSGQLKLARSWHAIGHPQDSAVVSSAFIKTAHGFNNVMNLVRDLSHLSLRVNAVLAAIDPVQFEQSCILKNKVNKRYASAHGISAIDPLVMEGRVVIFNRTTNVHRDKDDPRKSWAILVMLGDVQDATLRFPSLRLTLPYNTGDIVALRGNILPHEVGAWTGSHRLSIAHFTHKSLWDEFGMECP